jgi:hypothetical protein
MADETIPDPLFRTDAHGTTPQELADRIASLAVEYALRPTPNGLDVLTDLIKELGNLAG